jgi:peptide-methionine (S)-S-oxide reductase
LEFIVLGGGCFWCTEAIFNRLRGVMTVTPGYAGGEKENPTYEAVSLEETGHVEVVQIEFDPQVISLEKLLDVFWDIHDATTVNRQGNDIGSQYRSLILYTTPPQKEIAEKSKVKIKGAVTEIKPLDKFYTAEEYHQKYFEKNGNIPYCQFVISPKLKHFEKKYHGIMK